MTIKEIISGLNDLKTDAETHREADGTIEDVFQHDMDVLEAAVEIVTASKMPESKLKPCPFCGREATTRTVIIHGIGRDCIRFAVCCQACHIEQHSDIENNDSFEEAEKAMKKAIEAWNRRTENETD